MAVGNLLLVLLAIAGSTEAALSISSKQDRLFWSLNPSRSKLLPTVTRRSGRRPAQMVHANSLRKQFVADFILKNIPLANSFGERLYSGLGQFENNGFAYALDARSQAARSFVPGMFHDDSDRTRDERYFQATTTTRKQACQKLSQILFDDGFLPVNPAIVDLFRPQNHYIRKITQYLSSLVLALSGKPSHGRLEPLFYRINADGEVTYKPGFSAPLTFMPNPENIELVIDKIQEEHYYCGIFLVPESISENVRGSWTPDAKVAQVLMMMDLIPIYTHDLMQGLRRNGLADHSFFFQLQEIFFGLHTFKIIASSAHRETLEMHTAQAHSILVEIFKQLSLIAESMQDLFGENDHLAAAKLSDQLPSLTTALRHIQSLIGRLETQFPVMESHRSD